MLYYKYEDSVHLVCHREDHIHASLPQRARVHRSSGDKIKIKYQHQRCTCLQSHQYTQLIAGNISSWGAKTSNSTSCFLNENKRDVASSQESGWDGVQRVSQSACFRANWTATHSLVCWVTKLLSNMRYRTGLMVLPEQTLASVSPLDE